MSIDLELDEEFKAWWSIPWETAQGLPRDDAIRAVAAVGWAAGLQAGVCQVSKEVIRDEMYQIVSGENADLKIERDILTAQIAELNAMLHDHDVAAKATRMTWKDAVAVVAVGLWLLALFALVARIRQ